MTHAPIPICRPLIPSKSVRAVKQCLESGWIGYGGICRSLESRFTLDRGGAALATSSCTSALYLAARLCSDGHDNEVIVPAMTFVSTAMAFLCASYKVVLADVRPSDLMLDIDDVRRRMTKHTSAVVVVHLFGQRFNTDSLRELCDHYGLWLIEDCAHRVDILDHHPPLGDFACYSFNAVKEAPAGEAGLLWCRSTEDAERARALSNVGLTVDTVQRSAELVHKDYGFGPEIGLKLRGNDVVASLALAALDILPQTRRMRMSQFKSYDEGLIRPRSHPAPFVRQLDDSFLMYTLRLPASERSVFRQSLASAGIATSIHYPALTRHPLFRGQLCPVAELADTQLITLPCFPGLTQAEQSRVLDAFGTTLVGIDRR